MRETQLFADHATLLITGALVALKAGAPAAPLPGTLLLLGGGLGVLALCGRRKLTGRN